MTRSSAERAATISNDNVDFTGTQGLRLTNEALENSEANFYVKAVGIIKRALNECSEAVSNFYQRPLAAIMHHPRTHLSKKRGFWSAVSARK